MFVFPRYLPLGKDSEPRCNLASLRHGLDTASPLVVHGLMTRAISDYQGRRFFNLQRDITGLLREVVKNEDSTRWQMKHAKAVKNAIEIGFTDLDTIYMALSLTTSIRPSVPEGTFLQRSKSQSRRGTERYLMQGLFSGRRATYYTHSRTSTASSFED